MTQELEIENTFLLSELPSALLKNWKKEFTRDIYYPQDSENPQIRLRQRGKNFVITKKRPLVDGDLTTMVEETIQLTSKEYEFFRVNLKGKSLSKNRYSVKFKDYTIEIDEYLEKLAPLIVLDIEWENSRGDYHTIVEKFKPIKEITNIESLAAGKLAGKSYEQIKNYL